MTEACGQVKADRCEVFVGHGKKVVKNPEHNNTYISYEQQTTFGLKLYHCGCNNDQVKSIRGEGVDKPGGDGLIDKR